MSTRTAFCTTCQREVYLEVDDAQVCPVCSSPLIETPAISEDVAQVVELPAEKVVELPPEVFLG